MHVCQPSLMSSTLQRQQETLSAVQILDAIAHLGEKEEALQHQAACMLLGEALAPLAPASHHRCVLTATAHQHHPLLKGECLGSGGCLACRAAWKLRQRAVCTPPCISSLQLVHGLSPG